MPIDSFKKISSYRVFLLFWSVFGGVKRKDKLLTARNNETFSRSMERKVDLNAEGYYGVMGMC